MTGDPPTRRQVLTGAMSLGITALAGCQTSRNVSLEPKIPAAMLEESGWQQLTNIDEERTERIEVAGTTQDVHVESKADLYGNDRVVRRVAHQFDVDTDKIDVPGETFLATKARVDPPLTELLAISDSFLTQAMNAAETQAKSALRERGFRNIQRVEQRTIEVKTGQKATHREYRADYPYESFEFMHEGQPITVKSGKVTIEAQVAIWPYHGLVASGAGVYPGESGQVTVGGENMTRQVDLNLQPKSYAENVLRLIRSIS